MGGSNSTRTDFLAVGFLLAASAKLVVGLRGFMDIDFRDETYYLSNGIRFLSDGPPAPENSPLYSAWYFVLSLFQRDPVKLHYLNYQLLTALIPMLLYIFLRRLKVSTLVALLISAYSLISFANLPSSPKSSHFALLVVLLTCITWTYVRSTRWGWICLALGALLGSYVRPELFLAFIVFSALFLVSTARRLRSPNLAGDLPALILLLALPSVLFAVLGTPVFMGEHRSFLAFRQHFSVNWVQWNKVDVDPWAQYSAITSEQFGGAGSIWEAVISNPALYAKHVAYNTAQIPVAFGKSLFLHYSLALPADSRTSWVIEGALFLAAALVYIAYRLGKSFDIVRRIYREERHVVLLAVVWSAPAVLAAMLFLPKRYYLTIPVFFSLILLALFFLRNGGRGWDFKRITVVGILLVALTPCLCRFGGDGRITLTGRMRNIRTIEFIRSLGVRDDVTLLTAEGRHHVYCGPNFSRITPMEKTEGFARFVDEYDINMILVTERLKTSENFKSDEEWLDFSENCDRFGFRKMVIPHTGRALLVRADLIPPE